VFVGCSLGLVEQAFELVDVEPDAAAVEQVAVVVTLQGVAEQFARVASCLPEALLAAAGVVAGPERFEQFVPGRPLRMEGEVGDQLFRRGAHPAPPSRRAFDTERPEDRDGELRGRLRLSLCEGRPPCARGEKGAWPAGRRSRGYRKGEEGVAEPDPERAPHVRRIFELYASGRHTDRTLAEWLNGQGQRTVRGRLFGADTVREMLCNAAYCGYVSARRDISKQIRGQHEPIVEEQLFDRVQELRRARARTLKPGRPSARYLLRGLARCERCQGKMQGTAVGRRLEPRYLCAGRRASQGCDQPLIRAEVVEAQLVEFVADFKPEPALQEEILHRLAGTATSETTATIRRRAALEERLRRLRDLYELGDLDRRDYLTRREAIQNELAELAPQPLPDLAEAKQWLDDFSIFWHQEEQDLEAKRQLLQLVFERIWLDQGRVVAVRPKPAFAPFFKTREHKTAAKAMCKERERRDSNPRPPA
jgi:hypothetical protein